MANQVRIDKWLWAVRIFKTRGDAADACRSNKVLINGSYTKASRDVAVGDVISVKKLPVTYQFKVLALIGSRQGAKLVPEFAQNITPQEELDKLNVPSHMIFVQRDRGTGRPTKRERRDIDGLMEDYLYQEDEED